SVLQVLRLLTTARPAPAGWGRRPQPRRQRRHLPAARPPRRLVVRSDRQRALPPAVSTALAHRSQTPVAAPAAVRRSTKRQHRGHFSPAAAVTVTAGAAFWCRSTRTPEVMKNISRSSSYLSSRSASSPDAAIVTFADSAFPISLRCLAPS